MEFDFLKPLDNEILQFAKGFSSQQLGSKVVFHSLEDFPDLNKIKIECRKSSAITARRSPSNPSTVPPSLITILRATNTVTRTEVPHSRLLPSRTKISSITPTTFATRSSNTPHLTPMRVKVKER